MTTGTVVNAGKEKFDGDAALALVREASKVVAAKGKKVVTFKMKDEPADEDVLKAILGPSGNLRAPAWKRGKTLVVGFNAEAYDELLNK